MAMAERTQPRTTAVSTAMPSNPCLRFRALMRGGGGVMVWDALECGFESGEAFFEGTGDGEEPEEGGFGDVAALIGMREQRCA